MVADLRKMQENQGVSENRIDKCGFFNRPVQKTYYLGCKNKSVPTGIGCFTYYTYSINHGWECSAEKSIGYTHKPKLL